MPSAISHFAFRIASTEPNRPTWAEPIAVTTSPPHTEFGDQIRRPGCHRQKRQGDRKIGVPVSLGANDGEGGRKNRRQRDAQRGLAVTAGDRHGFVRDPIGVA